MNNEIQIFQNAQFGSIRTTGTPEMPLFCLTDICRILELEQVSRVKSRLKEDGVTLIKVTDALGRLQETSFINEQNLYKVIMRSDKPQAEPFQDWVCGEVLPSIRKHGMYATETTVENILNNPDNFIQMLQAYQKERNERMAAEQQIKKLEAQEIENKPKVVYANAVIGSESSCLIGELAKKITQNGHKIGEKRLFKWLRDNHYLCAYGERYNQPYQQYVEQGLFTIKQTVFSINEKMVTRCTTKVTGKGQVYFINLFIGTKDAKDEN